MKSEEQPTVRDEIIKIVVSAQPNIKYKELNSLVNSFEVSLQGLRELQVVEDKKGE